MQPLLQSLFFITATALLAVKTFRKDSGTLPRGKPNQEKERVTDSNAFTGSSPFARYKVKPEVNVNYYDKLMLKSALEQFCFVPNVTADTWTQKLSNVRVNDMAVRFVNDSSVVAFDETGNIASSDASFNSSVQGGVYVRKQFLR